MAWLSTDLLGPSEKAKSVLVAVCGLEMGGEPLRDREDGNPSSGLSWRDRRNLPAAVDRVFLEVATARKSG